MTPMGQPLARVAHPAALDASDDGAAQLAIAVPRTWLSEGAVVSVKPPRLLRCGRCDGGGCDLCDRSGALRTPTDAKPIELTLPQREQGSIQMRLVDPFGDGSIPLLLIRIDGSDRPGPNVERVADACERRGRAPLLSPLALAVAVAAIAAALLAFL
jgi:hypothetical protein